MRNNTDFYFLKKHLVFSVLPLSSEGAARVLEWLEVKSELAAEELRTSPCMNSVASAKIAV